MANPTAARRMPTDEQVSRYERILRRLRQRIFDYDDTPKEDQAARLIRRCKAILAPYHERRHHDVMEPRLRNYHM